MAPFVRGRQLQERFGCGALVSRIRYPESLAYASLAQLPPVTGMYCYLAAGIAYALFGTQPTARRRPHLRSGNCCGYRADDPERGRSLPICRAGVRARAHGRAHQHWRALYRSRQRGLLHLGPGPPRLQDRRRPLYCVDATTQTVWSRGRYGQFLRAYWPRYRFLARSASSVASFRSWSHRLVYRVPAIFSRPPDNPGRCGCGGGTDECVSPSRDGHKGGRRAPPRPA